ncbi:hypothetical protein NC651_033443 [Populus alba x Populus x berolinensis]|nr:hypothetical protein NC651_033443 [Populus alba x Populus x berolinensis]
MVKFDIKDHITKVITRGPWMIFDHYLAVCNWSSDFNLENVYCNVSLSIVKISASPGGIHEDCFVVTRRRRPRDNKSVKSKEGSYGDDYDDDNNKYVALHNMEKSILIAYKSGGLNDIKVADPVIEAPIKSLIDKTVHR